MADVKRTIQKDFRGAGLFLNAQALASLSTFVETSGGGRDVIQSILEAVEDRRKECASSFSVILWVWALNASNIDLETLKATTGHSEFDLLGAIADLPDLPSLGCASIWLQCPRRRSHRSSSHRSWIVSEPTRLT